MGTDCIKPYGLYQCSLLEMQQTWKIKERGKVRRIPGLTL